MRLCTECKTLEPDVFWRRSPVKIHMLAVREMVFGSDSRWKRGEVRRNKEAESKALKPMRRKAEGSRRIEDEREEQDAIQCAKESPRGLRGRHKTIHQGGRGMGRVADRGRHSVRITMRRNSKEIKGLNELDQFTAGCEESESSDSAMPRWGAANA